MTLIQALISAAISLAVLVVGLAIVEAMRRRGFDAVGRLASFIAPMPAAAGA